MSCSDGHTTSNDLVEMKVSIFSLDDIDDDGDGDLAMAFVPLSFVEARSVFVASNTTDPSLSLTFGAGSAANVHCSEGSVTRL